MQIDKQIISKAVKHFKEYGTVTWVFLMRKYGINLDTAKEVCNKIEKKYPNLWKNRRNNFNAK